ncbi:MAG TPA: HupE/UreJ family protein, partial [Pseudolabrys sp.]|nr:HupE/UreJ family protein [Pseudolabrys sp.]
MKRAAVTTFVVFFVLAPAAALAHPGHDGAGGLVQGFVHPVTGVDHVLAMIAVGVLAALYGGRALWLVPMSFLVAMAAAGAIGMAGIPVQIVEAGIGLSIVVLGLMIAFQIKPPALVAMVVVGFFALFHGYAHGSEMPDGAAGLSFAAGFLIATALLLSAGAGLGLLLQRRT